MGHDNDDSRRFPTGDRGPLDACGEHPTQGDMSAPVEPRGGLPGPAFRYSVILSFMGQLKDRFSSYHAPKSLEEKFSMVSQVAGVTGVEMVYPDELADIDLVKDLLLKYGLRLSSINVNLKGDPRWHLGALTSSDSSIRGEAVRWLERGMDVASSLGGDLVTVCPLADGHDYPFEIEFGESWKRFVKGVQTAADGHPDIRLALEYKRGEPRAQMIIPNVGMTLHACSQIDRRNVGVTLDIGHALFAGEHPAQAVASLAAVGKLFHVHGNDNYRNWDWDMVPGSVNFWDLIESTYYLMNGYDGWIAFDVFPSRLDPVEAMKCSVRMYRIATSMIDQIGQGRIAQAIQNGDPLAVLGLFQSVLDGGSENKHGAIEMSGH